MSDCLFIHDLTIETIIGILAHERTKKQPVILDLTLFFDFTEAAQSDDFNKTIDYADVTENLINYVSDTHYQLIEKLADQICHFLLNQYPIDKIQLTLTKPNALPHANVGVIIERQSPNT